MLSGLMVLRCAVASCMGTWVKTLCQKSCQLPATSFQPLAPSDRASWQLEAGSWYLEAFLLRRRRAGRASKSRSRSTDHGGASVAAAGLRDAHELRPHRRERHAGAGARALSLWRPAGPSSCRPSRPGPRTRADSRPGGGGAGAPPGAPRPPPGCRCASGAPGAAGSASTAAGADSNCTSRDGDRLRQLDLQPHARLLRPARGPRPDAQRVATRSPGCGSR